MRRILTATGLVAALAAPALAPVTAQARGCEARSHDHKVVGTVLGAVAGGFLGNAVARGGGRLGGTIIGAGAGAVVGNNLARSHCDHRHASYRREYRHAAPAEGYAAPAAYTSSSNGRCHTETRSFYDAHGQLVYAPTQVCD